MSIEIKNSYIGQPGITDVNLYECPVSTTARVIKCTVTNDTTTAATISFNKVPAGGSVGDTNLILNAKAIGSKETYECPEIVGQVLEAGDKMYAVASVADQLTVSLGMVETV